MKTLLLAAVLVVFTSASAHAHPCDLNQEAALAAFEHATGISMDINQNSLREHLEKLKQDLVDGKINEQSRTFVGNLASLTNIYKSSAIEMSRELDLGRGGSPSVIAANASSDTAIALFEMLSVAMDGTVAGVDAKLSGREVTPEEAAPLVKRMTEAAYKMQELMANVAELSQAVEKAGESEKQNFVFLTGAFERGAKLKACTTAYDKFVR